MKIILLSILLLSSLGSDELNFKFASYVKHANDTDKVEGIDNRILGVEYFKHVGSIDVGVSYLNFINSYDIITNMGGLSLKYDLYKSKYISWNVKGSMFAQDGYSGSPLIIPVICTGVNVEGITIDLTSSTAAIVILLGYSFKI